MRVGGAIAAPVDGEGGKDFCWLAFLGAGLSIVTCYFVKITGVVSSIWGGGEVALNVHVQAALMCGFAVVAIVAIWRDRKVHGANAPLILGIVAVVLIAGLLYIYYDARFETVGYFFLLAAAFLNQRAMLATLHETVADQARELEVLNASLEERVETQVAEIDRLARLKRFLAPEIAALVTDEGQSGLLDSHRGFIACIFGDIRNFTAMSDGVEPEEVMHVLQEFHAAIGRVTAAHGGTIGNRSGDGVMVIVGDPVAVDDPSQDGLALALDMMAAFDAMREAWRRLGYDIGFGVGLASGYATLGMIGDEGRFDYTAIGNTVNLAARLCATAADGQILMNRRVFADAGEAAGAVEHGALDLKGFDRAIEAFRLDAVRDLAN